jgi:hypothetical protein
MAERWASSQNIGIGTDFEALHAGLTVRMIETPRAALRTCQTHDTVSSVLGDNVEGASQPARPRK